MPITEELKEIREEFEGWLEENCQKGGKNLRAMLKKVETAGLMGRR
jgi:checkpoint serine/threonine-protein kinase